MMVNLRVDSHDYLVGVAARTVDQLLHWACERLAQNGVMVAHNERFHSHGGEKHHHDGHARNQKTSHR